MSDERSRAKTRQHPEHGYRQLDPKPEADELSAYYESAYYDPLRRAPDRRQGVVDAVRAAEEAEKDELNWRSTCEYADIAHYLAELAPGRRVLDVGAGIGELVAHLAASGFDARGIEPADEATEFAQSRGRAVTRADLAAHAKSGDAGQYDAVALLNVLEHVLDPEETLALCRSMLAEDGVICLRVPNDFSKIQDAVIEKYRCEKWWIAAPDHISYFSRESLSSLLHASGFRAEVATCDFPIDWFLLMGENYLEDRAKGGECHRRRKAFERALDPEHRRSIYRALAEAGCGRNLLIYARRTG